jgi:hypothetical protein
VKTREKTKIKESYQEPIFLFHEYWYGTAIRMVTVPPRLTVTGETRRIAFVTGSDFIGGREGVLVLHDWI